VVGGGLERERAPSAQVTAAMARKGAARASRPTGEAAPAAAPGKRGFMDLDSADASTAGAAESQHPPSVADAAPAWLLGPGPQ
jgi:hypothetical protein